MKIKVKVKSIEIVIDDSDNTPIVKYESSNIQLQNTIKSMCDEALKLLKEIK